MITQKPISLKIDTYSLTQLDNLKEEYPYISRNGHINRAIAFYLEMTKAKIHAKNTGEVDKIRNFIRGAFPVQIGELWG